MVLVDAVVEQSRVGEISVDLGGLDMQAVKAAVASTLLGALVVLGAGCGGSDPEAARTPTDAVTITNGQTGETPATTETGGGGGGAGDVAAGKAKFVETCQGCHSAAGTEAGVGPKLEGIGWSAAQITKQIENGGGPMPGGLVSGTDLDNVVAYVVSLQGGSSGGGSTAEKPATTTAKPAATTPTEKPATAAGDAAAGKTFFEATCQGSPPAGGSSAGVGPELKGIGWSPEQITKQVENGGGPMPAGLAKGDDLKNVVAYVSSLQ